MGSCGRQRQQLWSGLGRCLGAGERRCGWRGRRYCCLHCCDAGCLVLAERGRLSRRERLPLQQQLLPLLRALDEQLLHLLEERGDADCRKLLRRSGSRCCGWLLKLLLQRRSLELRRGCLWLLYCRLGLLLRRPLLLRRLENDPMASAASKLPAAAGAVNARAGAPAAATDRLGRTRCAEHGGHGLACLLLRGVVVGVRLPDDEEEREATQLRDEVKATRTVAQR